jgi:hypothetical protein
MTKIKISGISKLSDVESLKDFGVTLFSFDTRPLSLNFTQAEVIDSIMQQSSADFGFIVGGDSLFAKNYFLDQISAKSSKSNVFIEVDDNDQKVISHHLIDRVFLNWSKQRYNPNLHDNKKFIISLDHQDFIKNDPDYLIGTLRNLQVEFQIYRNFLGFEFKLNWGSILPANITDFFPIYCVTYQINSEVESSFKNLDLTIVESFLKLLSSKYSE